MNIHVAPPYAWVFFAVLCVYLLAGFRLIRYLRRSRPDLWIAPYDPSVGTYAAISNWARVVGLIMGLAQGIAADGPLQIRLWSVRALLALTLVLMVVGIVTNQLPTR